MALLLRGKSECSLCGQIIKDEDIASVRLFPAYVLNELDPCFLFSDASFHETCVSKHPYGSYAIRRAEEWYSKVGPGKRKCVVCAEEVIDPDNYLLIEHLSDREGDPLRAFNYTHLHKSCIPKWGERLRFIELVNAAVVSGLLKSPYFDRLINEIRDIGA
jgi:hypothetical protein